MLTLLSVAGCGPRLSHVDSRDYLADGGTCEEMILLDGKPIGVQETVFEPVSGREDGAVLLITVKSRIDDDEGPFTIAEDVSRYGTDARFLGAEGTMWNRRTGDTTAFSTPKDAPDGRAALVLSLLRSPLKIGDTRTVRGFDMFAATEMAYELTARENVRLGDDILLAVDIKTRFGNTENTGRMYCDAAGNVLRSDLVVFRGNVERRIDKDGKTLPKPIIEAIEKTMTIQRNR